MEYVIPPIVTEVTVKLTTPEPELDAENIPVKVAAKLSLPAIGTVCVIVRVKVPEAAMVLLPEKKVWKLPKLEPVGVFKLVDPRPVNVIINALPKEVNVTELVPLPAQPAQVKVPDVEKVTGSAFAVDAPIAMKPASNTVIIIVFMNRAMFVIPSQYLIRSRPHFNRTWRLETADGEQTATLLGHDTQVAG
jgi:hypothetical protein